MQTPSTIELAERLYRECSRRYRALEWRHKAELTPAQKKELERFRAMRRAYRTRLK